jgi:Protein of unknown function, DUF255/Wax ester synthase-like Acyl-CoA acyltransferase domain
MPNRLASATSPYLQQHADNPVDWFEWGDEAFAEARRRDVPLLISIGYAACHWCHVMAHESFEDPATAAYLNEHFVAVKVDREERPDVDAVYMEATQAMTGGGGWPMTVFATPDGDPFSCGTYFPPRPLHGLPSFGQVLGAMHEAWTARRDDVDRSAVATRSPLARRVVEETAGRLLRELRTDEDGFASSLDADSPGPDGGTREGAFSVWTLRELVEVLGPDDGPWAATMWGVTEAGTFERGSSVLQLHTDPWPEDADRYASARSRLFAARASRPRPARDDKVVAAWNGLAVAALADAGDLLGRPDWVDAAAAAADLLLSVHVRRDGPVLRLARASRDGVVGSASGVLEDYADRATPRTARRRPARLPRPARCSPSQRSPARTVTGRPPSVPSWSRSPSPSGTRGRPAGRWPLPRPCWTALGRSPSSGPRATPGPRRCVALPCSRRSRVRSSRRGRRWPLTVRRASPSCAAVGWSRAVRRPTCAAASCATAQRRIPTSRPRSWRPDRPPGSRSVHSVIRVEVRRRSGGRLHAAPTIVGMATEGPRSPDVVERAPQAGRDAVERISPGDLVELATDVGPVPMNVGAVLLLAEGTGADVATVLEQRIGGVARLRQRLVTPPWGLGRPYWVDDADFDIEAHVSQVRCPSPGDEAALLAVAVDAVTRPLPRSRPLWRAVVVTGLADEQIGLVVVLHHVLADGIGGLAVLARLVDGDGTVPVSARASTTSHDLGNRVGVMPVRAPVQGSVPERLARVAELTRAQKTQARGASAALVGPVFRLLASAGLFRWFVDRQRLVNSFLTNMAGPPVRSPSPGRGSCVSSRSPSPPETSGSRSRRCPTRGGSPSPSSSTPTSCPRPTTLLRPLRASCARPLTRSRPRSGLTPRGDRRRPRPGSPRRPAR